jgi:hypothetical protein
MMSPTDWSSRRDESGLEQKAFPDGGVAWAGARIHDRLCRRVIQVQQTVDVSSSWFLPEMPLES